MKTRICTLTFMLFLLIGSFSCAQKAEGFSVESVLVKSLSVDTAFIRLIKIEDKIVDNQLNNLHDHKHVNWSLIEDKAEQAKCKTQEDLKQLLLRAGMKEVDAYLLLKNTYTVYMAMVANSHPKLNDLVDNERLQVFQQARNLISQSNKF